LATLAKAMTALSTSLSLQAFQSIFHRSSIDVTAQCWINNGLAANRQPLPQGSVNADH